MFESLKKNRVGILMMCGSSILVCIYQLLWKLAAGENLILLFCGFVLFVMSAVVMLFAYRHGSLSVLHPMMSLNYIISIVLGWLVLSEPIGISKAVGVIIITAGVLLIGGGDNE